MHGYHYILIIGLLALFMVFIYYIGRIVELSSAIKGKPSGGSPAGNSFVGFLFMLIGFSFLTATVWSFLVFKDTFLPESASYEGVIIDDMTETTFIITGIVYLITHILLFFFAWKYRYLKTRKAEFIPHNNRLEVIWTVLPSLVLSFLIYEGITAWDEIMAPPDEAKCEVIEVTAKQFGWVFRYPGPDGIMGKRSFSLIDDNKSNEVGLDTSDTKGSDLNGDGVSDAKDDLYSSDLVLPKDKDVLVRLRARDVLHSFFLPHFRVKMDCVPGMPTHFNFKPRFTTQEMRDKLKDQNFNFELACAEMCGTGHYGMMKEVRVVTLDEYKAWVQKQFEDNKTYLSLLRQ